MARKAGALRMSQIELAPEVGDDIDRILDHLAQYDVEDAPSRIEEIIQVIAVLEHNPFIGIGIYTSSKHH